MNSVPFGLVLGAAWLSAMLAPRVAFADICAWNKGNIAPRASAMIKPNDTVQLFCPGCGDTVSTPIAVRTVQEGPVPDDPAYHEVLVNGENVDLAYTYVRTAPNQPWTNLGSLVNCSQANDSPRTLGPDQVSTQPPK